VAADLMDCPRKKTAMARQMSGTGQSFEKTFGLIETLSITRFLF